MRRGQLHRALGERRARWKELQALKPRGGNKLSILEGKQKGQCGWSGLKDEV